MISRKALITIPLLALKGASRIVKERKDAARGDEASRRRGLRQVDTVTIQGEAGDRQQFGNNFFGKNATRPRVKFFTRSFLVTEQRLAVNRADPQAGH